MNARAVVERVARESYAKLIAHLSTRSGDIAAAEDALAEAMRQALESWPISGIPQNPEGWISTAAQRRLVDAYRRTHKDNTGASIPENLPDFQATEDDDVIPDERLGLFFVCAHPAIDENVRSALMLQTVLGLDAEKIASAFLVSPAAMAKRLVRAKNKIRLSKIPFEIPAKPVLPERLHAVLEAIYAAYGIGWQHVAGADGNRIDLAHEAIFLARMLTEIIPQSAEAWGLLALMAFSESRRPARITLEGDYVPLRLQDTTLWNVQLIYEANDALRRASSLNDMGPYQLEAAIQAVHAARGVTGQTDWQAISQLYQGLMQMQPGIGVRISYAAAELERVGTARAFELVEMIEKEKESYQPYWALLGEIHLRDGNTAAANAALARAMALASDPATRKYLQKRIVAG